MEIGLWRIFRGLRAIPSRLNPCCSGNRSVTSDSGCKNWHHTVSILVVVEIGLWQRVGSPFHGLNPCCSGNRSVTHQTKRDNQLNSLSLNPCCSGNRSVTAVTDNGGYWLLFVSILVVVEIGLWHLLLWQKIIQKGLNPCCSGNRSVTYMFIYFSTSVLQVSILVVVEIGLWLVWQ